MPDPPEIRGDPEGPDPPPGGGGSGSGGGGSGSGGAESGAPTGAKEWANVAISRPNFIGEFVILGIPEDHYYLYIKDKGLKLKEGASIRLGAGACTIPIAGVALAILVEFAGIYFADNTVATTIPSADTWTQVDKFDVNGPSFGAAPDATSNHITIGTSGVYFISSSISFSGAVGNDVWELEIQTNGGTRRLPHFHAERKVGAAGDVGSASISGVAPLVAGETVELWVKNTSGSADITVRDASVALHSVRF